MNIPWYVSAGVWAYAAAALAFAWLAIRLTTHWQPGHKPAMLLGVAVSSVASAIASCVYAAQLTAASGFIAALLDFVRVAITLGFLLIFLGIRQHAKSERRAGGQWASVLSLGIVLLALHFLFGMKPAGLPDPNPLSRQLGYGSALAVGVFGLVLVEQCYRRTPFTARWHIRPLILGFAGLFAFDIALYSDALLFRTLDFDLWFARGFAQALTVPLILVTLRRRADWSFDLSVSRSVVAGSTALLLTGVYLLILAGAGFLLREFGGSWGRVLESVLVFGAILLLAALVLSGTFRAKVRVLVAKHFFAYRYDYREQWLGLTNTLTSGAGAQPWSACIEAIGALVESPGGALWFRKGEQRYLQVARSGFPAIQEPLAADHPLPRFLQKSNWILDIGDVTTNPSNYEGLVLPAGLSSAREAWLIVPLMTGPDLVGFIALSRSRVQIDLDWEVLDLLKTAGRQAAGYLAYAQAMEALLEAQKFDAFNRMSTFVVHDLKNLIAQLQLVLSNAERHRDNPDFQRDMMKTIEHVVGRMHQLTLQLRPEASVRERPQPVDVGEVVRRAQSLRFGGRSGLAIEADAGALAWAHDDLLERVVAHLVQNGFDACEGEQTVQVRVERRGDEVLVEVTDEGKGMTPEFMREHLFKPFQTTKDTGTGIGAFECQQYVQQVGGRIEVQSTPGKGTKVSVHLRGVASARVEVGAAA